MAPPKFWKTKARPNSHSRVLPKNTEQEKKRWRNLASRTRTARAAARATREYARRGPEGQAKMVRNAERRVCRAQEGVGASDDEELSELDDEEEDDDEKSKKKGPKQRKVARAASSKTARKRKRSASPPASSARTVRDLGQLPFTRAPSPSQTSPSRDLLPAAASHPATSRRSRPRPATLRQDIQARIQARRSSVRAEQPGSGPGFGSTLFPGPSYSSPYPSNLALSPLPRRREPPPRRREPPPPPPPSTTMDLRLLDPRLWPEQPQAGFQPAPHQPPPPTSFSPCPSPSPPPPSPYWGQG